MSIYTECNLGMDVLGFIPFTFLLICLPYFRWVFTFSLLGYFIFFFLSGLDFDFDFDLELVARVCRVSWTLMFVESCISGPD